MQRGDVLIAAAGIGIMFAARTRTTLAAGGVVGETPSHILVLWRDGQQGQRLEVRGRVADAVHKPVQGGAGQRAP